MRRVLSPQTRGRDGGQKIVKCVQMQMFSYNFLSLNMLY